MSLNKGHFDKLISFTNCEEKLCLAHVGYDYEYLVDYHPYRKGNNPHFDNNSQMILDFKEGYPAAIEHFAGLIDQDFNPCWNGCCCVAVPSHNPANNYSPEEELSEQELSPLERLALAEPRKTSVYDLIARLVDKHTNLYNGSAILIRTQLVDKKSAGGNRAVSVDLNSIEINGNCGIDISGKNILLIDDVITTGSSIAACRMILKKGGAKNVFVLCLGKTSLDPMVSRDTSNSQSSTSAEVSFSEEVPF